jgi:hypothetical protein
MLVEKSEYLREAGSKEGGVMKGVNLGRVILGGLVAGIVVNISEFLLNGVVLKKDYEIIMKSMNKPTEMTALQGTVWIVYCFVVGIAAVWLYTAIRSRYGASAGTAGGRASPSGSLRTCSPTSPWPT